MSRPKEYRIIMRKNKIKRRKENINLFGIFKRRTLTDKWDEILDGDKPGYLNKCHYGSFCSSTKTKTKNAYASYRHKGGYGKAVLYSRHDKKQIIRANQAIDEYKNNELI